MNFTYETTYEDCSPDGTVRVSAEVRITYTVNWGCPARIHYDEHDHPAEGDELEISKFEIGDVQYAECWSECKDPSCPYTHLTSLYWRKPSQMENDTLEGWADNERLRDDMLCEAREQEQSEIEAAQELAAEAKEELRRMGP